VAVDVASPPKPRRAHGELSRPCALPAPAVSPAESTRQRTVRGSLCSRLVHRFSPQRRGLYGGSLRAAMFLAVVAWASATMRSPHRGMTRAPPRRSWRIPKRSGAGGVIRGEAGPQPCPMRRRTVLTPAPPRRVAIVPWSHPGGGRICGGAGIPPTNTPLRPYRLNALPGLAARRQVPTDPHDGLEQAGRAPPQSLSCPRSMRNAQSDAAGCGLAAP
jgi:hypothetical protein